MPESSPFYPVRDDQNPFAAPEADLSPGAAGREAIEEAEEIRREYQKHEANIKSIGILYYLGAGFCGLACAGLLANLSQLSKLEGGLDTETLSKYFLGVGIGLGLIAVLNLVLGIGLRRFMSWARWGALIQTSLGLVAIVIGMLSRLIMDGFQDEMLGQLLAFLLSAYIFGMLISPKNQVVFAPAYKEVIAQTPHIRTGMGLLVKILLAIVGLLFLLGFLGLLASKR